MHENATRVLGFDVAMSGTQRNNYGFLFKAGLSLIRHFVPYGPR